MSCMLYNCINYRYLDLSLYINKNIVVNYIFYNNMTIIYKINKNGNEIKIFGENFVENNKYKCYLSIKGKRNNLCSYFNLNKNKKEILEIKLIEIKPITNMSYMFYECHSLNNISDISKWDIKNVSDIY